ncbi:MAG: hypothetical protein DRP75_01555 [Candidatus Omnitrophota bacterium]|nr:MAG: hypothetical protein DRP75_01555 [Candidatus Omnitrophota bacterium]
MNKIISICNQKGGVGKTTTVINLATYLALKNHKTLLVDIDPQSNTTNGIGINSREIRKSIYDFLISSDKNLQEVIINTQVKNLFLIPSNIQLSGAEIELINLSDREFYLKRGLEKIKDDFEYIFIDCPPSLSLLTINALTACDSVIIPIQCEYYALEGLTQLLDTIKQLKDNLNPRLTIEGMLLTMADFRTNLTKQVIKEVREFFKKEVYKTIIPRCIRLSEAPSFGKPIALFSKRSQGAKSYLNLTNEFLKRNK